MADMALKEEANKKAFEKFTRETKGSAVVEVDDVSERYESELIWYFCSRGIF